MRATDTGLRRPIGRLMSLIVPGDEQEACDQAEALRWVESGAPLFRTAPPATPPIHLAVYFALLEHTRQEVLLVDHIKANRWLLPGGHVDVDEDPRETAVREAKEELGVDAEFHPGVGSDPLFVSRTRTLGANSHVDVTLWFVLQGKNLKNICHDAREARSIAWFGLDSTPSWPSDTFDPNMQRFVRKLAMVPAADSLPEAPINELAAMVVRQR